MLPLVCVNHAKGEQVSRDIHAHGYMECSSLLEIGVKELFNEAIRCGIAHNAIVAVPVCVCNSLTINRKRKGFLVWLAFCFWFYILTAPGEMLRLFRGFQDRTSARVLTRSTAPREKPPVEIVGPVASVALPPRFFVLYALSHLEFKS